MKDNEISNIVIIHSISTNFAFYFNMALEYAWKQGTIGGGTYSRYHVGPREVINYRN